ncbi:DUF4345 family protein [Dyadobacter sandarakinus]|uniref:DUF4345 family protein n=1 Tax=Dyadobacter sandarakinus TaxID=2747268 RepID=A0ABX7I6G5_9BACT|nr:DUF4345 family protein [Dyadobacter sandarakinus]QRR01485.1 DUF4345 family protein [Dyadobacter sandarakinus]
MEVSELTDLQKNTLLSQYRFLRALELGFGVVSIIRAKEILNTKNMNFIFLCIMTSGVLARAVGMIMDGAPSRLSYFFWGYELIGIAVILLDTHKLYGSGRHAAV